VRNFTHLSPARCAARPAGDSGGKLQIDMRYRSNQPVEKNAPVWYEKRPSGVGYT
jgi:hypothetical protein